MNWDQIHPGLIFPKAEVTFKAFDHVAVKLFFGTDVFEGILKGKYLIGESLDEEKAVRKFHPRQMLDHLVVINKDARTGKIEVARFKYSGKLIKYFAEYFATSSRPPLAGWEMDARESYNNQCGQGIKILESRKTNNYRTWMEAQGTFSTVFIQQDNFTDHLEGVPKFYPESIYSNELHAPPLCIYKTDDNLELPLAFTGDLKKKDGTTHKIYIYLHWLTNPIKAHTNARKHLIDDTLKRPAEQEFWKCNPSAYKAILQNCPKKIKGENDWECDAQVCHEKNLFPEIHPQIKKAYKKFMATTVTFFEKSTTIPIWIGYADPKRKDLRSHRIKILYSEHEKYFKYTGKI